MSSDDLQAHGVRPGSFFPFGPQHMPMLQQASGGQHGGPGGLRRSGGGGSVLSLSGAPSSNGSVIDDGDANSLLNDAGSIIDDGASLIGEGGSFSLSNSQLLCEAKSTQSY